MYKIIFSALILSSLNVFAANYAPISGECAIDQEPKPLDFPTGNGSLFPKFQDGTMLSVFASPSDNFAKDEKGVNLFDITIDATDKTGNGVGSYIFRHLTASPKLKREFDFNLLNGSVVNCKF